VQCSTPSPVREQALIVDLHLQGRRVLVTGASKGIGAAAARAFAEEGCTLHLAARGAPALDQLAQQLRDEHRIEVTTHAVDLRSSADIERLADAAGNVDVLVNNAGDIPPGSLDKVDEARWRHAWELKVFGYINLTRRVYAAMKARGGGVIINDIGAAGERVDFDHITASAGNAALMAFTRALGSRSLSDGIRVVGVNPGPVETDRLVTVFKAQARNRLGDESRYRELMTRFPMGRAARPREIADAIVFLASDRSAYTSGVIVTIDGGLCATGL
jgi:NAD(P)-dependent dehydrogenase (short-subunit alcohol dehydrogenase family)